MDIKQLTAFVTVAELGSVTRAADSLHSTQSSVTRQIQALEQELGVMLFERNRHGMTPTIAGRSRIEREYLASNQRRFFVPCPACGEMQWLRFEQLLW